jgi:hypothetical protein
VDALAELHQPGPDSDVAPIHAEDIGEDSAEALALQTGDLHTAPGGRPAPLWHRLFDAASEQRQGELLAEMARFDPALELRSDHRPGPAACLASQRRGPALSGTYGGPRRPAGVAAGAAVSAGCCDEQVALKRGETMQAIELDCRQSLEGGAEGVHNRAHLSSQQTVLGQVRGQGDDGMG